MNNYLKYFLFSLLLLMICSCGSNINNNQGDYAGEAKNILDSNNNYYDEYLKISIIGSWTSTETVRGETVVFDTNGRYSGYDGREEYNGEWKINNHKINLSTGGLFWMEVKADTLFLDSTKYIKDHPGVS